MRTFVTGLSVVACVVLAPVLSEASTTTVLQYDVNMLYPGRPYYGVAEMPPGAGGPVGAHAAAIEAVAYRTPGVPFGDIYVVAYQDTLGRTSATAYDTYRQVQLQQIYTAVSTSVSLNPAGHTGGCVYQGINYSAGCGWIVGYRHFFGTGTMYLYQVRNLGGTSGVGYATFNFSGGVTPAADAGYVGFEERILMVYPTADRSALKAQLINTAGGTIGREFTLFSGGTFYRPQVAWLDTAVNPHWVVTFERKETCPGYGPWGKIRGMYVTWNGTPVYPQDTELGWCGMMDSCGGTLADGEGEADGDPSPLNNPGDCYGMWLAARAPDAPVSDRLMLTEYSNWYMVTGAGSLYSRDPYPLMGWLRPVAGTDVDGYAFRGIAYSSGGHAFLFPDALYPIDPSDVGQRYDEGDISNLGPWHGQGLRRGHETMAALFTTQASGHDLYMSILNN
jgi:hypothetical protein